MIDLEKAKKRVEGIIQRHKVLPNIILHGAYGMDIDYLLTLTRDLIAEVERQYELKDKLDELAKQFKDERDKAEREKAELESQVGRLRETLNIFAHLQCLNPTPNLYGDVCGVTFTCGNCLLCRDAQQALASTSGCGHEEEEEIRTKQLATAKEELVNQTVQISALQIEIKETKKRWVYWETETEELTKKLYTVAAKLDKAERIILADTIELKAVRDGNDRLQAALDNINDHCRTVYSHFSGGRITDPNTLPDEVIAEAADIQSQEIAEHLRTAKEQWAEGAILQATLDEAEGKVMKFEFWKLHALEVQGNWVFCRRCNTQLINTNKEIDGRHFYTREQWTEQGKKVREKK